jgi:hypothetical protein
MMAAGMRMGQQQAEAQYQAQAQQQAAVEQARQESAAQAQAQVAFPATAAGDMNDATITQLQKLADLRKSGILTDEEFTAAKKKILG